MFSLKILKLWKEKTMIVLLVLVAIFASTVQSVPMVSAKATVKKSGYKMVKITGSPVVTAKKMIAYIKDKNSKVPQSVLDMIPLYLSEAKKEGIRGDVAFAQSCLETGYFKFIGSAVKRKQNNFGGLGVTKRGKKGSSFKSARIGIRAQVQHLKAYANKEKLKLRCVDPRFAMVARGCAPYVEYLGIAENPKGKGWASGKNYGKKILKILNDMKKI